MSVRKLEESESRVSSPGTLPLLVEIGCEEIPARFLAAAQREFGEHLQEALREAVRCDSGNRLIVLRRAEHVEVEGRRASTAQRSAVRLIGIAEVKRTIDGDAFPSERVRQRVLHAAEIQISRLRGSREAAERESANK